MGKRKSGHNINGILLLDKRTGISSNGALQEVRRLFNANKAGHTGSLDPLATGILPVCFGEATKMSTLMLNEHKAYEVTIHLGIITDTGDTEGTIIAKHPVPAFTLTELEACLQRFRGAIMQVPPMYSALKYQGKKLYELARAGQTVERPERPVTIFTLQLITYEINTLQLSVSCSKGTYIRSLAEDIGHYLGCGATVSALRRTQSGCFNVQTAKSLTELQTLPSEILPNCLLPIDAALASLPIANLPAEQAQRIKQGQQLEAYYAPGLMRLYHEQQFLGLGEMLLNGKLAPKRLLI